MGAGLEAARAGRGDQRVHPATAPDIEDAFCSARRSNAKRVADADEPLYDVRRERSRPACVVPEPGETLDADGVGELAPWLASYGGVPVPHGPHQFLWVSHDASSRRSAHV